MIELISAERCTGCNICVRACPVNVFDTVPGAMPVIARQADCQSCFMCELWCPEDALYVAPEPDGPTGITLAEVTARGLLGSYRRAIGWAPGSGAGRGADLSFQLLAAEARPAPPGPASSAT
ncbi:4Fe-4S dicluster domain-containing protein [Paracraurococcus lichenis]|uniref:Ferredoxin family protein n=1 Tax=Paracraurococcus lichenis TaxID=3064888 RepID=A0ABT9E5K9_9PROT|nr:ferredoxin family protein [Paracraurococcus sp. LOR1-02]MDO9711460.1 ferredoxin family protein [Paracraurococcus sp. LOR1-02]